MIAKTFLFTKDFRAYGTNYLRQNKFFRDHDRSLVTSVADVVAEGISDREAHDRRKYVGPMERQFGSRP